MKVNTVEIHFKTQTIYNKIRRNISLKKYLKLFGKILQINTINSNIKISSASQKEIGSFIFHKSNQNLLF